MRRILLAPAALLGLTQPALPPSSINARQVLVNDRRPDTALAAEPDKNKVWASPNLWFNPDGSLGSTPPLPVYNDGLSIYGPTRWVSQQVTITPYVTTEQATDADRGTTVRMLNGFAASGRIALGTGAKAFTVATGLNFVAGVPVTAVCSDLSKSMTGSVGSYSGTTVVLDITSVAGTGSCSTWVIGRDGKTTQNQTVANTSAATAVGASTLTFANASGFQVGAAVESAANGIAPGTYIVSTTSTTITLSAPVMAPGITLGQLVRSYSDQGVFLYQDISTVEGVGFNYGTPAARTAHLSFAVRSFGVAGTASVMFLGYSSISTLGRSLVLDFPVTTTKTWITLTIPGDGIGGPNTWATGYNANSWGGLWAALGFSWESQGTSTSANIQPGYWQDSTPGRPAFAAGGSANQTFDLTHTVGAWVEVSGVNLTLGAPTATAPARRPVPSQPGPQTPGCGPTRDAFARRLSSLMKPIRCGPR